MPDDSEALTIEEAAEVLGVSREASPAQVERAFSEKLEGLEKKLAQAATAALKNKYRLALEQLKHAREAMENQDTGSDLPSLEAVTDVPPPISKPAPEPAPKPEPVVEVKPQPKPEPKPEPRVEKPAAPKKPLPVKMIGIAAAAVLGIGALVFVLMPHPSAKFAGDYRKRVGYETVVYDYSINVSNKGVLSGFNQVADKNSKPINIIGQVDEKGVITAKGDDKSVYTGKIEGEAMKLEEKPEGGKPLLYSLTKGMELPKDPPQAEYAGTYHSPSVAYPSGVNFEFEFELAKNGDLKGSSKSLKDGSATEIVGRVNTRGKIKGTVEGSKTTYEGEMDGDAMVLKETLGSGTVFNIKVTKGLKKRASVAPPPPAKSPYAGLYHAPSIEYPNGSKFEYEAKVQEDGTFAIVCKNLKDGDILDIKGTISAAGKVDGTGGGATYSGEVKDDVIYLEEKLASGKTFNFKITKGAKEKAPMEPAAAFVGDYRKRISYPTVVYDYSVSVSADGTLKGSNQIADKTIEAISITGTVDSKGAITAKGSDDSAYTGTIEGDEMKLSEKLKDGKSVSFDLTKGVELPENAPQAKFAGVYHNTRIVDANGDAYEYKFIIESSGAVSGYYTRAVNTDTPKISISGRVNTVGKLTAESEAYSDGRKTTFAGKVADGVLKVVETTINGKTFEYEIPVGGN
ncbi:MAG: hypothetical protein ACK5TH_21135 [Prosthecobacter sp.]|jgi:hypothetical protein